MEEIYIGIVGQGGVGKRTLAQALVAKSAELLPTAAQVQVKTKFDFKLCESLWKSQEDAAVIFHAEAWCENAYHVYFTYDGKEECVGYWKDDVEDNINLGKWIVLD